MHRNVVTLHSFNKIFSFSPSTKSTLCHADI